jgi:hypothetical protein
MNWLTSLPAGVLVAGWVVVALLAAALGRWLSITLVPVGDREQFERVASALMPALGATFAVLIAITLSSEAGYLRQAQDVVSDEAAAASRLAWAATSPRVAPEPIHEALLDYLQTTRRDEWRGDRASAGAEPVGQALAALERATREQAAQAELGTPASSELLSAVDAVSSTRRERLAAASRQIPVLYVVTLVASGLALVGNAGALTYRTSKRSATVVVGLAVVVGLSLALLFALGAPWRGPLVVGGGPLDSIVSDLQAGFFHR